MITPVSSLKQLPRATQSKTHGHIIRADPTAPSTDVVEISEDVFQRELCSGNVAVESDRGIIVNDPCIPSKNKSTGIQFSYPHPREYISVSL